RPESSRTLRAPSSIFLAFSMGYCALTRRLLILLPLLLFEQRRELAFEPPRRFDRQVFLAKGDPLLDGNVRIENRVAGVNFAASRDCHGQSSSSLSMNRWPLLTQLAHRAFDALLNERSDERFAIAECRRVFMLGSLQQRDDQDVQRQMVHGRDRTARRCA